MSKQSVGRDRGIRTLAVPVFPGFQTLDLFGPLEMLGDLEEELEITVVAESLNPVRSVHGQCLMVVKTVFDGSQYDLLLMPGGDSALEAAKKSAIANWIVDTANNCRSRYDCVYG